jgi:hypothetical protein
LLAAVVVGWLLGDNSIQLVTHQSINQSTQQGLRALIKVVVVFALPEAGLAKRSLAKTSRQLLWVGWLAACGISGAGFSVAPMQQHFSHTEVF